ncbi:MAG: dTMP kinase [Terriglobia bacterium]
MKRTGLLITLEGIDGTGKSTQIKRLAGWLRRRGFEVRVTREPGGTRAGEQIRKILLSSATGSLAPLAELALMYAARAEHLDQIVRPALAQGMIVISDRFNDASFAYQGFGRRLGERPVRLLDDLVCGPTQPDLTFVLDAPPGLALARTQSTARAASQRRFESSGVAFYRRVRRGYLAMARRDPARVKVIRASLDRAQVQAEIRDAVERFLSNRETRRTKD